MPEPHDDGTASLMATYDRHAPKMYRVAIKLGIPSAEAGDIIQGIFMVYVMQAHEVENVPVYLWGCLLSACRRHLAPPDAEVPPV